MKIVAVSQRVDVINGRNETRDALDQRLVMFIAAAGGLAVPVPNTLDDTINTWFAAIQPLRSYFQVVIILRIYQT